MAACSAACRSLGDVPTVEQVGDRVKERTGQSVRPSGEPGLPPNVSLDDGLTQDEAGRDCAVEQCGFQRALADLGVARADVAAGPLRNPVLTLLLP